LDAEKADVALVPKGASLITHKLFRCKVCNPIAHQVFPTRALITWKKIHIKQKSLSAKIPQFNPNFNFDLRDFDSARFSLGRMREINLPAKMRDTSKAFSDKAF